MSKIKLSDTLTAFNKKQLRQLQKFVISPYFNSNYNAIELENLLELLIKELPRGIEKSKLQQHFFPDKPFLENSKNAIDNLLTDLNALVEKFIVVEELRPLLKAKATWAKATFFSKVKKEDRLWPIIVSYRRKWNKKQVKNLDDMRYRYEVEELATNLRRSFKAQQKESGLEFTHHYLDKSYLAEKIKLAFIREYESRILNGQQSTGQEDPFWIFLTENYDKLANIHTPLSNSYFQAYRVTADLNKTEELDLFERLLEENEAVLPQEDLENLYVLYRSYRGRQYQLSGNANLAPSFFNMYKKHLEKGRLKVEGKLLVNAFKILVTFGIKVKDYDWVKQFLEDYPPSKILGTRYPEEFHRLCKAELLFAEKKYEAAEEEIEYRLFEEFTYSLSCDILLIKTYFETQNDLIHSRLRAMELKVRRAKLKEFDKKAHLAFISIVRKLDKYLWLKEEKKLVKIRTEIKSDKPLIQREWLMGWAEKKNHSSAS